MQKMEILDIILEIISILLLIMGIALRKKIWGQRIVYFALGMIFVFLLRRFLPALFMMP
jgi:hypothetical protein